MRKTCWCWCVSANHNSSASGKCKFSSSFDSGVGHGTSEVLCSLFFFSVRTLEGGLHSRDEEDLLALVRVCKP
jgi:hypothetical protein